MLRASETTARFCKVGRIAKSHGKNGEVLVQVCAETFFDELLEREIWIVPPTLDTRVGKIEGVRPLGDDLLIKFSQVTDLGQAREISGRAVYVEATGLSNEALAAFQGGERDTEDPRARVLGYAVTSAEWGELGTIVEVIETGANDVWVMHGDAYGEVLLPVIEDCVLEIDDEKRSARVYVLPGLIDCDAGEPCKGRRTHPNLGSRTGEVCVLCTPRPQSEV
jgi:16S rRNA processing protein RimM